MDEREKKVDNLSFIVRDVIQGDEEDAALRKEFSEAERDTLRAAFKKIVENPKLSERDRQRLLLESWRIHYKEKPPTISEFLTEKWIGPTANSLYPYIRELLEDFWDTASTYRHLLMSPAIGYGKSTATTLSELYVAARLWCMRDPKAFYEKAESSVLAIALISFSLDKAKDLLVSPFYNIMESSDKFMKVRTVESMEIKQRENPDRIVWTKAGNGAVTFSNKVEVKVASSPHNLLGLNLIQVALTELNFFLDRGYGFDHINRLYWDSRTRVNSRFTGFPYLSGTIIDSSPNDYINSPIDRYIFSGEASKDPTNYVVTGATWEFAPFKFKNVDDTFPVFKGTASRPAKILEESEVRLYNPEELVHPPVELKPLFEANLIKQLKDLAGVPAGSQDRLVTDYTVIEGMFAPQLKNIYKYVYASSTDAPERLIWNQVVNDFFIHLGGNKYEFYRNPREARYVSVDQSVSGDITGISMCHPENSANGELIYVVDFTVAIIPNKGRINLQAIEQFIRDLRDIGRVPIRYVSFDIFQSENTIQQLKRDGFEVQRLSVDTSMAPYLDMVSLMHNGRVKVGRNVFLKNNMKSLKIITLGSGKKKVDHTDDDKPTEEDGGDWQDSRMGLHSKDVSDAVAASIALCKLHYKAANAKYLWLDDAPTEGDSEDEKNAYIQIKKAQVLAQIKEKYKVRPEGSRSR